MDATKYHVSLRFLSECNWCELTSADCPDRMEPDADSDASRSTSSTSSITSKTVPRAVYVTAGPQVWPTYLRGLVCPARCPQGRDALPRLPGQGEPARCPVGTLWQPAERTSRLTEASGPPSRVRRLSPHSLQRPEGHSSVSSAVSCRAMRYPTRGSARMYCGSAASSPSFRRSLFTAVRTALVPAE